MKKLYIGRQFTDDPAGRYYTDGDGSGEEFREEILKPILRYGKAFQLNIDEDVEGYGSSFLVEAFGGLVKHGYFTSDEVMRLINIEFSDSDFEFYSKKIKQYVADAKYNSVEYVSTKDEAVHKGRFKGTIDKGFIEDFEV